LRIGYEASTKTAANLSYKVIEQAVFIIETLRVVAQLMVRKDIDPTEVRDGLLEWVGRRCRGEILHL
jgi:hypothetical protein